LASSQFGVVPAVHTPPRHVSAPLQAFPSLQLAPSAAVACWQRPPEHVSTVQPSPSLHWAEVVQAVQPAIGACAQPVLGLHESVVHALPSSQVGAAPAAQTPP
jgi:hypothetical protein